ncbi:MAG: hypothetical protein EA379_12440, partial [Phycisphaerales bacterium]
PRIDISPAALAPDHEGPDRPDKNPDSFVRIVPGAGFTADTPQPAPIGAPGDAGHDAKAIARWDVVPYQTFTGEFHIGVVAFHMNGIDRVEFSADGGAWVAVDRMQLNPRTDVWEYTAVLDAADFDDGPVEVRAVVYPSVGVPRVLAGSDMQVDNGEHSIFLYADASAQLATRVSWVDPVNGADSNDGLTPDSAKRTMHGGLVALQNQFGGIDGGTVYLMAGIHEWESRSGPSINPVHAMVTFEAAPGLTPDDVKIADDPTISGLSLRSNMVTIRGVTIRQRISDTTAASHPTLLWIDRCKFPGEGMTTSVPMPRSADWQLGLYMTGVEVSNVRNAFKDRFRLVRHGVARDIGEDAFVNVFCVIDSSVERMTFAHASYHPDVVQYFGPHDNTIVYGLIATDARAQTIFSRGSERHDNAAFVNVLIERTGEGVLLGQWIRESNHVLFSHCTHVGTRFWFRPTDPNGQERPVRNLVVRNSVFQEILYSDSGLYPDPSEVFYNNHYITGNRYGASSTSGGSYNTIFANTDRFNPFAGGVLDGRVAFPDAPIDLFGVMLPQQAAIGSAQPE